MGVTPQYALDSERNLVPYVLGNDGSTKLVGLPDNLTPVRPMKFMDLGDRRVGVNAYSGEESATHDKGLPPQDTVEHQENVTDAKERVKLRVKKKAAMPKDRKGITAYRRKAERVRNFLNEARSLTNAFTAGYGAIFSKWPASAQRRLNNVLDSIRANIGFSELQDMRNNSPTGGALGQVSERELHLLNSVLGSLDQWQSPEDLMKVYDDIDGRFDTGLVDMENAFNEHYADIISGGSQKPNDQADNDPLGLR